MEITTAYIFGILTVIAITLVIVIVIGIVKVLKQQKMIESINKEIYNNQVEFHSIINEVYRHIDSRVDKLEAKLTTKINK